jgi:hypothetical protein
MELIPYIQIYIILYCYEYHPSMRDKTKFLSILQSNSHTKYSVSAEVTNAWSLSSTPPTPSWSVDEVQG